jgi:UDP-glucose 4-epimerase
MSKILVTGGMGFIGRYVVEELQRKGFTPVIFDHHKRSPGEYPSEVEVFMGDVRDDVAVVEAMAHVDGWIHLAAVLGTQETINNPRPAALSNLMGGLNMFEAASQYKLPGVYIAVGNWWMNNSYSITKNMLERFICMYNADRGTKINVVRAVNAYGPRQLAAAPFGPGKVRKITPAFICRALSKMPIEVYGGGVQVSDMVYVVDVAKALVLSLEAAMEGRVFDKVVEVGPAEHHTVYEVADMVRNLSMRFTNFMVDIKELPMRPGELANSSVTADVESLKLIGMNSDDLIPLETGLIRTISYFNNAEGEEWFKP